MKKIACYKCSKSIEIKDSDAFTKINCPSCSTELTVPKICGDFVLSEKMSNNEYYETFKGHKAESGNTLVIKLFSNQSKFNDETLTILKKKLSVVPEKGKLELIKTDGQFLAYRPFYETSIEAYLKNSRPKSEKAVYLLDQAAGILDTCLEKNVFPVNLTVSNLLMDKEGQVIISDLLFRESVNEVLDVQPKESLLKPHCTSLNYLSGQNKNKQDTIFAFGCLAYVLCCGNYPWPFGNMEIIKKARNIQPEVILDLRGEYTDSLKLLIKDLIDEKNYNISSFKKIRNILGLTPVKVSEQAQKKSPKKKALSPANKVSRIKTNRKKQASNPVPIFIGIAAVLVIGGLFFLLKGSSPLPKTAKVEKHASSDTGELLTVKTPVKKPAKKLSPKTKPKVYTQVKEAEKTPIAAKPVPKINRDAIKAELMPLDFNFDPIVGKLDEYIAATDKKDREIEEDKIEIVSMFRDHLLIHFYRHPYTGVFHLQNKGPIRAKIVKADEDDIHLLNLTTKKPLVIKWKDFEFTQFKEFADYYAASYTEEFSLSESNDAIFNKVSEEYVRLAVVLDWYGFKDEAIEYKKKALAFDSSKVAKLDLMIKEAPTN